MGKLQSIQILRFYAAALVLFSHLEGQLLGFSERFGVAVWTIGFSGRLGVDIFFVISGFIMGWLSLLSFARPGASTRFMLDRVTRVVPLYWICTMATFVLALLAAALGHPDDEGVPGPFELVKSLSFFPYLDGAGKHRPVMTQGWTLDFEMMFYVVFAACLFLRRPWALVGLATTFVAIYAVGFIEPLPTAIDIWADPIIFEFLIGVALALIRERFGAVIPIGGHAALLALPIALLTAAHLPEPGSGLIANAVVATGLVAVCVLGREVVVGSVQRLLARFGDWSYSLYLTHGFVVLSVGIAWRKAFGGEHLWAYAGVIVALSMLLSWLSFTLLEIPITRTLRTRLGIRTIRAPDALRIRLSDPRFAEAGAPAAPQRP